MLCYANTGATITATKREPRRDALDGAKMSHSQPGQAPRWHVVLTGGCALHPFPPRAGAGGRRGSTAGSQPCAGATTSPLPPPPPSRDGHLRLTGPPGSAWAPLGALPKKQLCARALETVINSSQEYFFFFFFFFHATSQCNICFGGLSKEKARC